MAAAEPAGVGQCLRGFFVQYGVELHHQHQLAGVLGRIDHELPDPDGGARGAELHVGRHRDRGGVCADSWSGAASSSTIGNFWVDLTRTTLYVLLPIAAVLALVLASQGVVQTFSGYKDVTTVETLTYQQPKMDAQGNPVKDKAGNAVQETVTTHTQTLPMGPMASQESIKELGTNGGGFTNANSAHPFENPNA